jgi:hypothetical protein
MEHKVQVFLIDDAGQEKEVYKQSVPALDLRALAALVNKKARAPRAPAAKKEGSK